MQMSFQEGVSQVNNMASPFMFFCFVFVFALSCGTLVMKGIIY